MSAAGAAGAVAVIAGRLCFGPAQGGLPFSTRSFCLAAPAVQVLVCGLLHRPLFVVIVGGVITGGGTGVVTGGGTGVGTVCAGGGGGGGGGVRCVEAGGAGREIRGRGATVASRAAVGCGSSRCVVARGRETCSAGRTSAAACPGSAGAVPGMSPAGGECRISRERATDPATAAPAGTNDPIAAILGFIPSSAPSRQPSLRRLPPYRRQASDP